MAVMMGVDATITLEVAELMVIIPVLKKIRYNEKPKIPVMAMRNRSLLQKGFRMCESIPMMSSDAAATVQRMSPRSYGEKYAPATFVRGKAAAHRNTVIKEYIFSLTFAFIDKIQPAFREYIIDVYE